MGCDGDVELMSEDAGVAGTGALVEDGELRVVGLYDLSIGGRSRLILILGWFLWISPVCSVKKFRCASEAISIISGREEALLPLLIQNAEFTFSVGMRCAMHNRRSLAVASGSLKGGQHPDTNRFLDLSFSRDSELAAFVTNCVRTDALVVLSIRSVIGTVALRLSSSLSIWRMMLARMSF